MKNIAGHFDNFQAFVSDAKDELENLKSAMSVDELVRVHIMLNEVKMIVQVAELAWEEQFKAYQEAAKSPTWRKRKVDEDKPSGGLPPALPIDEIPF